MNKKVRAIVVVLILLAILGINISYAISNYDTSSFFEVNKTESAKGETLEMMIDLSKVDYREFEFALSSNVKIDGIYTDENSVMLDEENNDISIDINKDKLNLSKIVLHYQIPEDIEIGTKIELNAQIKIENDNEEKNDSENQTIENSEQDWVIVDTKQVEITIIEKDADNKNDENKDDSREESKNEENKKQENNMNMKQQENQQNEMVSKNNSQNENIQEKMTNSASSAKNANSYGESAKEMTVQTEAVTYNGSNNNYLSSLEIEGVQLTTDFNKEKLTYFATVQNIETITVTAVAEDSSSKVAITGTNLKSGENKVLISVTAENGEVRYYRIYVTKN